MFRALFAAIKPVSSQDFVIDFVTSLAHQHHLTIDAASVIDLARLAPAEPVSIGGGAYKAQRDQQVVADARQNAAKVIARLDEAARALGVACNAQVQEGDTVEVLAAAVQRCDLFVCGHTPGGDASERSLLHSILKHSPRPAIVVPQKGWNARQEVLVAYDGSAQAARALASYAGSGLAEGRTLHIVSFDDGTGKAAGNTAAAQAFLQRHGIASDVRIESLHKDAASQILNEAQRVSAGLIVMGAFGRSAVRDFFLGSVTRSILGLLPVPVFLDH